jgi:hypothetical protein
MIKTALIIALLVFAASALAARAGIACGGQATLLLVLIKECHIMQ